MQLPPIEAFMLVTPEDYIFEVKGVLHPPGRVVAYLRYVPNDGGPRETTHGLRYKKIYALRDRTEFLRSHAPEYLWFDPYSGRGLQSVPMKRIVRLLDPTREVQQRRSISPLYLVADDLVDFIADESGVPGDCIGLTGSLLCGISTPTSDIDIVVYGATAGQKVYDAIGAVDGDTLQRYHGEALDSLARSRWGGLPGLIDIHRHLEARKRLQGYFHGSEFFIRLVKLPWEVDVQYGDVSYTPLGRAEIRDCVITSNEDMIYTPCLYEVVSSSWPEVKEIVSYRGRFTEQASVGDRVTVRGRLERVLHPNRGEYWRIVVGEDPADYMIPASAR